MNQAWGMLEVNEIEHTKRKRWMYKFIDNESFVATPLEIEK